MQQPPKPGRWWATIIGSGIALSPIHNQWLTHLATNSQGETLFFLPTLGYLLLIMGVGMFLLHHWEMVRKQDWGEHKIVIPLIIIVTAIGISGITANTWQDKIAPLGAGLAFFAVYLAARVLGKAIFIPLAVGAAIASIGVITHATIYSGQVTGGYVFEGNYDIVVGYVMLGAALFIHRRQWILISLALLAMFLSGSPEGVFATGAIAGVIGIRQDWGKRLIWAVMPTILVAAIWFSMGWGQELHAYTWGAFHNQPRISPQAAATAPIVEEAPSPPLPPSDTPRRPIGYRIEQISKATVGLKPLGGGFSLTEFREGIVHNVPLIIVQQLGYPGILAAAAWLWVSAYCLKKTRWKYAWVLVFALSIFDHYIWTQLAPVWWAVVGVSTASSIKNDLVFK